MQKALLVGLLCLAPAAARADFIFGASLGSGMTVKPELGDRTPTNIMITPGYGLGEMLRLELGILGDLGDVQGYEFDLALRPMLVIDPPVIPLHFRLIAGVSNLLNDATFTWGGAIGVGGSLAGLGIFGEVGMLPREDASVMTLEGRAGVFLAFD